MRVGIDARLPHYSQAGIGLYIRRLVQALTEVAGEEEFVLFQSWRDAEPLVVHPRFSRRRLFTPCHHPWEQLSLPWELLWHPLDVLHSPDFIPPFRRRCPAVITVHDLAFLRYPHLVTEDSRRHYGQVERAVRSAEGIIAVSENTKRDLVELLGADPQRIDVVYHAAEPCFHPLEDRASLEQWRRERGLPRRYLLAVGTIEPRKNLPALLEAYRSLGLGKQRVKLVLVGGRGWLCEDVFTMLEQPQLRDDVVLYGPAPVGELPLLYNGALALVFPSLYEGFGFPVLEAMACGTPVVCSGVSSLPEVGGEAALYVDPTDVEGLARAMKRIVDDEALRQALRAKGLAQASRFSWHKTAQQTLQVYHRASR